MKRTSGRILAFALAFAMVAAMAPAIPVRAVESVDYIDEYGESKTCETYTELTSGTTTLGTGWYVVSGNVTINDRLKIDEMNTKVNIILKDGCALTVSKGIGFTDMNQGLNIYGQREQSGTLTAYGYESDAAIGATSEVKSCTNSNITINGGTINATASGSGAAIGAGAQDINTVTINGGKITAKAGNGNNVGSSSSDGVGGGAGIGSGAGTSGGSCSAVIINGGTVTATGGPGAAGIGGGYRSKSASSVTINGGTVTATGGAIYNKSDNVSDTFYSFGAGIGGGAGLVNSDRVTISGGTIIAIGGKYSGFETRASGIGNKYASDKSSVTMNLTISGGIIYATSIDEKAQGNIDNWSGVVFDGSDGKVYGSPNITEKIDLTVPSEIKNSGEGISKYTLEVPGGSTLTVEGITIPSGGTLNVGTQTSPDAKLVVNGSVSNSGTVEVYGDVEGSISGTVKYHYKVEPKITFDFPKGDNKIVNLPTGEGTATVTIKADEVKNYFNANDNTVTVNYGGSGNLNKGSTTIKVTVNPKPLTFTFTPTDRAYNETNVVDGTLDEAYKSQLVGSDVVTASATATVDSADAGDDKDVTVEVTLAGADAGYYTANEISGVTVDISKADLTEGDVTAPKANSSVGYTGEPVQLLSEAGSAPAGCTVKYAVKKSTEGEPVDGDWKTAISEIKGTEAGEYKVYWKVDGGKNYNEYTPASGSPINVSITKTAPTLQTEPELVAGSAYTGEAKGLIQTEAKYDGGTVSYLVKKDDSNTPTGNESEWTKTSGEITGTDAGTYYVWYKVTGDDNHADVGPTAVGSGSVVISKAEATVTVGDVDFPTYGSEITLTATVTADVEARQ